MNVNIKPLAIIDFLTDKKIGEKPAYYVTTDNNEIVIFCIDSLIEDIEYLRKNYSAEDLKECTKISLDKFNNICDELVNFVKSLDENKIKEIVDNLPKVKTGKIRNAPVSIYNTNVSVWDGYCANTWQIICEPHTMPAPITQDIKSIFAKDIKIKNTFMVSFSIQRPYDKKEKCVVNPDGTMNKLEYKANSYVPTENLVPGKIYLNKKDKEVLYVGKLNLKSAVYLDDYTWQHAFIELNKKNKETLINANNFVEWYTPIFTNAIIKHQTELIKSSGDSNMPGFFTAQDGLTGGDSYKVCEELETAFEVEDMKCDISFNDGKVTHHFIVFGVGEKPYFQIERETKDGWESYFNSIYICTTKEQAKIKLDEYKTLEPNENFRINTRYCSADIHIVEGDTEIHQSY